jgi:hypothetical protein
MEEDGMRGDKVQVGDREFFFCCSGENVLWNECIEKDSEAFLKGEKLGLLVMALDANLAIFAFDAAL